MIGLARALLLAAVCLGALPAMAAPWTITVTGTVYSDGPYGSPDQTGLFGNPGESLVGFAYTQTITTDPLLNTYFAESVPDYHQSYGGAGIGGCWGTLYDYHHGQWGYLYADEIKSVHKPFVLVQRAY